MADTFNENLSPDIPVYLFTGFLDAGKTRFIQETLEDRRFNRGERTLLLVCEEGDEEYDLSRFKKKNVFLRNVEYENILSPAFLSKLEKDLVIERVMVEYNGMWLLDSLYRNLPDNWVIMQEFCFADCRNFLIYNENMRQLVYDKLNGCELVVFNRAPKGVDIEPIHKIVRGANRSCSIAFEEESGKVYYDETEDPLPFDLEAPIVEIEDRDYAIWYRDMGEEMAKYKGKTVRFKGQIADLAGSRGDSFIIGRNMMNCCAADIAFAGLVVEGVKRLDFSAGDWVILTAKIQIKRHKAYSRTGPVMNALEIAPAAPPAEDVATFY